MSYKFKIFLKIIILLFIPLYLLKIILTLFNIFHTGVIYYILGIVIGVCLERWRYKKVSNAIDKLGELLQKYNKKKF